MRLHSIFKRPGHESTTSAPLNVYDIDSRKTHQLMVKVTRLTDDITHLEKLFKQKEQENRSILNVLEKYESVIREEIQLYQLQKMKIRTIENAYHSYESFIKDIENQLNLFINMPNPQLEIKSPLKRILLRFLKQKKFNELKTGKELADLERLIIQKQQLMTNYQAEFRKRKYEENESDNIRVSENIGNN